MMFFGNNMLIDSHEAASCHIRLAVGSYIGLLQSAWLIFLALHDIGRTRDFAGSCLDYCHVHLHQ
jgi:hypothetical protein